MMNTENYQNITAPVNLGLLPYQAAFAANTARFKIGLWARQTGKDHTATAEAVLDCYQNPGATWIIIAASERQALESLAKAKEWAATLKFEIEQYSEAPANIPYSVARAASTEIKWSNGSRLIALPASPSTIRGYSATLILIAFLPKHLVFCFSMNAYSYKRWSSAKQTDGDSFLRQTELARDISRQNSWNLVDLAPDAGISAFKGKNLSHKGILGQFIKRIDSGLINVPCVLIIERLDRFSRDEVDEVLPLFLKLLKSGVEVYSALENDHYTIAKIKGDPMVNLLKLVMGFVGANQYSKAIGVRVRASRQRKREMAMAGKQVWMNDCCPSYFDFDFKNEKYIINDKAKIVKRIFQLYRQNPSFLSVAKQFNLAGVKTFGSAKVWAPETIRKIITSRYAIGEFRGVKHYYPCIIDEKVFNEVQGLVALNAQGKGKRAQQYNFLKGILTCTCGMKLLQSTNKVGKRYFGCRGHDRGVCTQTHMVQADIVEQGLFAMLLQSSPSDLLKQTDTLLAKEVSRLQAELKSIEKNVETLLSVQDIGLDILRTKLQTFKKRQDTITKDLELKQSKLNAPKLLDASRSQLSQLIAGDDDKALDDALRDMVDKLKDDTFRKSIREPLTLIVQSVVCDLNKADFYAVLTTGVRTAKVYIGH
jgi:DNA invertase Pin-like site-specific DNA recombinase